MGISGDCMGGLGLCGAHRTGKTTLAQRLAHETGLPFVITQTSAVFREYGLDPAEPMDFRTRLDIQTKVLAAAEVVWAEEAGAFITDRTPLDMVAYTLGDIQGTTVVDAAALADYVERCFTVTNQLFTQLVMIQPGIPLVAAPGKAALNPAYLEHLNSLIIGLCHDERLRVHSYCMPRHILIMEKRMEWIRMHM
jgi:hypothetical protein